MNLAQAIRVIESRTNREICAIQYEDGSRFRFNVAFVGDTKMYFFNLKH
jgi:hypothetical protein